MPTKTGKTPASYYKSDVSVDQSTNVGFDSTTRSIISGDGAKSAISLSDDVLSVQPINDDTTGTMLVKNKGGSNILAVDTTNSKVLVGASQVAANTQYAYFGIENSGSASFSADTHHAIPFQNNFTLSGAVVSVGSSTSSSFNDTEPATSLTISTTAMTVIQTYWFVMDTITIDRVVWWQGADAATGDSTAAYMMSYTVDQTTGSTGGDLSDGVKIASSSTVTNAGYEQAYYNQMTIHNADVAQRRVILFTFASDTANSDYSINATVKYHII
tara:strand:+ start:183 stop:998 length:816 start_codon:yes stop_codon:yes gene_type:complete